MRATRGDAQLAIKSEKFIQLYKNAYSMVLFFLRDANRGAVYIAMVSTNSLQDPCWWALEGDPVTC